MLVLSELFRVGKATATRLLLSIIAIALSGALVSFFIDPSLRAVRNFEGLRQGAPLYFWGMLLISAIVFSLALRHIRSVPTGISNSPIYLPLPVIYLLSFASSCLGIVQITSERLAWNQVLLFSIMCGGSVLFALDLVAAFRNPTPPSK